MSTYTDEAVAQLAAITNARDLSVCVLCLFAFDKVLTLRGDTVHSCVVMDSFGLQRRREVSYITLDPSIVDMSQCKCVGIAIVNVNGTEILPHQYNMLKASPLVTDLQKAWKKGKFAPVIMPSSR
jgi:hypothetical protein